MERVGFGRLGIMGSPMAAKCIKAGLSRSPSRIARWIARSRSRKRARPRANATEGGRALDLVVTMVTSSPDVEAVTFGPDGIASGAHAGLLAIDMSTISPRHRAHREAARPLAGPPFHTLDAPVSGGRGWGRSRRGLAIMVGGDEPDVKRANAALRGARKRRSCTSGSRRGSGVQAPRIRSRRHQHLGVSEALCLREGAKASISSARAR